MRLFHTPDIELADLSPEQVGRLLASAADLALVVDAKGVIRDIAFGSDELIAEGCDEWLGRTLESTVTVESRAKIVALLQDMKASAPPLWRQVNHPSALGPDLPIAYAAISLPAKSGLNKEPARLVVFGRDLRDSAALQQRLIRAQQAMERDYWRLRHMETRYRALLQVVGEAVVILDATTCKVEETNPAADALLGADVRAGTPLASAFDSDPAGTTAESVQAMLDRIRATGRPESMHTRLSGRTDSLTVSASMFRQERSAHLLVRLLPAEGVVRTPMDAGREALLRLIERAPDAMVVTGPDGTILSTNQTFLDLAQLSSETQAQGQSIERWLGRNGVDLNVLLTNLRQRGVVRLFATVLRGEFGTTTDVEISAVAVDDGPRPCLGFTLRDVSRRLGPDTLAEGVVREMPRSVGQMTELVGRLPLRDIVRDTTDLIEQLCIEAALDLTRDNRALAAEMLGLSRQSLYVKMRRFNIGDLAAAVSEGN